MNGIAPLDSMVKMLFHEIDSHFLGNRTVRHAGSQFLQPLIIYRKGAAVQNYEYLGSGEGGALVAVEKGVVLTDMEKVGRRI